MLRSSKKNRKKLKKKNAKMYHKRAIPCDSRGSVCNNDRKAPARLMSMFDFVAAEKRGEKGKLITGGLEGISGQKKKKRKET